jgi:hypothetical protein
MQAEIEPSDILLVEKTNGAGMTVRYLLPRAPLERWLASEPRAASQWTLFDDVIPHILDKCERDRL